MIAAMQALSMCVLKASTQNASGAAILNLLHNQVNPICRSYSYQYVLSLSLFFSLSVFLCFFVWSLLWGLLLASSLLPSLPVASGIAAETQFVGWCL
jgi:hypothetical protein